MRYLVLFALIMLVTCEVSPANTAIAMTLEGEIEKFAVIEEPPKVQAPASEGDEYAYNVEGHIGIRVSNSGYIGYVHPQSPAEAVGLQKGDHVLLVDGQKHRIGQISGRPGTIVELQVKRRQDVFTVQVKRVGVDRIIP